jgi:hypothetical protein
VVFILKATIYNIQTNIRRKWWFLADLYDSALDQTPQLLGLIAMVKRELLVRLGVLIADVYTEQ